MTGSLRRRRCAIAVGAVAVAGCVLAGCGIPTEDAARAIPRSQVPTRILTSSPPSTTPTTFPKKEPVVYVYFLTPSETRLDAVTRKLPIASLTSVLGALLRGPTTLEITNGVRTALNSTVRVLGTRVNEKDTAATVDLSSAFGEISGVPEVLAVAQIVYTVDDYLSHTGEPLAQVRFEIDGTPTDIPTSTGALVPGPVSEAQYPNLKPAAVTAPTS